MQGPVGAEYAFNIHRSVKSVFVIHDKTAYGQGVAEFFRKRAEELGMTVAGFEGTGRESQLRPDY